MSCLRARGWGVVGFAGFAGGDTTEGWRHAWDFRVKDQAITGCDWIVFLFGREKLCPRSLSFRVELV